MGKQVKSRGQTEGVQPGSAVWRLRHGRGLNVAVLTALVMLLGIAFLPGSARASVESVQAVASPDHVSVGESFLYQVTVLGSGTLPTPSVNLPSSFQIQSGPNSSLNMQFINGHMSTTRTISYTLLAVRQGKFTIPAPEVKSKGKAIHGASVVVTVGGSRSGSSQGSTAPRTRTQQAPVTPPSHAMPDESGKPIFLQMDVEPREVYLQQPVTVTYTLYFQPQVRTYDVQHLSSTEGFWTEDWKVPNPPDVVPRVVNGERYSAAVIHRTILFPSKVGDLTIGDMQITVQYVDRRRSRSMFDSFFNDPFFGGGVSTADVKSRPVTIKVKPLPETGKPDDFQNVVGSYKMKTTLDLDSVQTNESVTLKVVISGEGNIGFLPEPNVVTPADIERYDPQVDESHSVVNGTVRGKKTFTYLLIPRRAGTQRIAPIDYSYYDPDRKKYVTLHSPPLTLKVRKATGWAAAADNAPGGSPALVQTVGTDIRWILDSSRGLNRIGPPLRERAVYWLLYLFPLAILGAGYALRKRRDRLAGQQSLVRSRKAARRALAALKQARELHAKQDVEEGYTALAKGAVSYLADRIDVPAAQLDEPRIETELASRNVSEASRRELASILAQCNSARFTPQGADPEALGDLIERTQRWITNVDRSLEPKR